MILAAAVMFSASPATALQEQTDAAEPAAIPDPLTAVATDQPYKPANHPEIVERWTAAREALRSNDTATASPLLEDLCVDGFYNACSTVGLAYTLGRGVERDFPKAISLLELGCRNRFANNCVLLAKANDDGVMVPKDEAKAHVYMLAACRVSDFEACWAVGERFEDGKGTTVNRDDALVAYDLACKNGVAGACTDIGNLFNPFPANPATGPQRDYVKATEFYRKGCEAGDGRGCGMLADHHETGLGVDKDLDIALELYRKAAGMEIEQWVRTSVEGRIKALEAAKARAEQ